MNTDYADSHMKKLTNVGINDIFPLYLHSYGIKNECSADADYNIVEFTMSYLNPAYTKFRFDVEVP